MLQAVVLVASPVVSLTCTFRTLLSKEKGVQECDATKLNSSNKDGFII